MPDLEGHGRLTVQEYQAKAVSAEELGDVLWYLTAVARRGGLSLGELAHNRDGSFADWRTNHALPFPFAALQPQDLHIQAEPSRAYETNVLKLAEEVGLLTTDYQANRLNNNRPALAGRLIAIFRTLINAANEAGVTLEQAAEANLTKIFDRWPQERTYPPLLDEVFPEYEHLPLSLRIGVFERHVGDKH